MQLYHGSVVKYHSEMIYNEAAHVKKKISQGNCSVTLAMLWLSLRLWFYRFVACAAFSSSIFIS